MSDDAYRTPRNLVRVANLDAFEDGTSATASHADHNPEQLYLLNLIRQAVESVRDDMSATEELVYCLRYEVHPRWTQAKIADAVCLTRQAVTYWEKKLLNRIERSPVFQDAELVRGPTASARPA